MHSKTIRIATYILPEFGYLIEDRVPLKEQYNSLISFYDKMDHMGKISLMSSLTKFAIQEKNLLNNCKEFLSRMKSDVNPEMQQRAIE